MTQEDKSLLLKDLSARLSYHVRCKIWLKDGTTEEGLLDLKHNYGDVLQDAFYYNKIKDIKPYLSPMSSMTEEERAEFYKVGGLMSHKVETDTYVLTAFSSEAYDWLNAHHFDFRNLIERGLAIAVTKENNPYKE